MELDYHYKHDFLVGYGEVDEHNKMRLSSFLNYLQDVATMHSKLIGYGTTECKEMGMAWMTLTWHIKMFSYPEGDTNIEVKTWSRGIKGCHASRAFEVTEKGGKLIAHVDSMWTWVNVDLQKIVRPSEEMSKAYGAIDRNFFEKEKVKITEPSDIDSEMSFKVQRRDIDTNRHCNNTKYIEYAVEAIPQDVYDECQVEELEIMYKKPVFYNDEIKITCTKTNDNEYVCKILNPNGETATLIRTVWKKF